MSRFCSEQWRGINVRTIQVSGNIVAGGVDDNFRGETMAEERGSGPTDKLLIFPTMLPN